MVNKEFEKYFRERYKIPDNLPVTNFPWCRLELTPFEAGQKACKYCSDTGKPQEHDISPVNPYFKP